MAKCDHYMLIPEDLATLFAEVTNQDMEASKQAKFFVLLLLLVIVQLKMLIQFSNVEIQFIYNKVEILFMYLCNTFCVLQESNLTLKC